MCVLLTDDCSTTRTGRRRKYWLPLSSRNRIEILVRRCTLKHYATDDGTTSDWDWDYIHTHVTDTHAQLGSKSWVLTRERPCHRSYVRVVDLWRNGWRLTTSSSTHNRSCRQVWSIGDNEVVQIYAGQSWINFNQQATRGRKQGASASTFTCLRVSSWIAWVVEWHV